MKLFKYIALTVAASACMLSSCSKNDDDSSTGLYQQYEIYINSGAQTAYANLRLGNEDGPRTRLGKGATLLCNKMTMIYSSVDDEEGYTNVNNGYNYFVSIEPYHKKGIFELIGTSGKVLRNEVDLSSLPNITFSSTTEEEESGIVKLNLDGASLKDVTAFVVNSRITDLDNGESSIIQLPIANDGTINVSALETKRYEILVDYVENHPTTQNDRDAKGNIKVVKRTRKFVTFKNETDNQPAE